MVIHYDRNHLYRCFVYRCAARSETCSQREMVCGQVAGQVNG